MSNVFFVGCGPGDPELITVKAKKLIKEYKTENKKETAIILS